MSAPPLDEDLKALIAESLHLAVAEQMEPCIDHIAPINTTGAFLLQHLTGALYQPVCGSIEINAGMKRMRMEAHPENVPTGLYYVWIERVEGETASEWVDFGARYWKAWAAENDIMWMGAAPPPVVWSEPNRIDPNAVSYTPHRGITSAVIAALNDEVQAEEPSETLLTWQTIVNRAIDHMMTTQLGLSYLVSVGVAEPAEPGPEEGKPS